MQSKTGHSLNILDIIKSGSADFAELAQPDQFINISIRLMIRRYFLRIKFPFLTTSFASTATVA